MKKVIFILFIIVPVFIFAQQVENDILYTINREQIPCTIQEISDSEIKYIRADKSATILYSTKKENVYCIIFKDGSVEYFSDKLRQPAEKTVSYAQSNAKPEITQNIVGTHVKQAQTTQQTQTAADATDATCSTILTTTADATDATCSTILTTTADATDATCSTILTTTADATNTTCSTILTTTADATDTTCSTIPTATTSARIPTVILSSTEYS